MTWEELKEEAKNELYSLSDEFLSNRYIMKALSGESVITFYQNGEVVLGFKTNFFEGEFFISKKMEYDKMHAIMKVL